MPAFPQTTAALEDLRAELARAETSADVARVAIELALVRWETPRARATPLARATPRAGDGDPTFLVRPDTPLAQPTPLAPPTPRAGDGDPTFLVWPDTPLAQPTPLAPPTPLADVPTLNGPQPRPPGT